MQTSTSSKRSRQPKLNVQRRPEAGATMIEMVVAMSVMLLALLGLVASMAWGLSMSKRMRYMTDTKLTITSMLEQMETLRNTRRLTFGQIANQGQVNDIGATQLFGGFPGGFQDVSTTPGPDGIFGTGDDLIDPGPDQTYGTGDDFTNPALKHQHFQREILITSLGTNLKKIQVTMRYPGNDGHMQDLVGISYLNNDANSNFR